MPTHALMPSHVTTLSLVENQACCPDLSPCAVCLASAASISTIVCDVVDKVNLVLDCVRDRKHSVKNIVLMQTPSEELVDRGRRAGIHILSLQEMEVQPSPPMSVSCPFVPLLVFL